MHIMNKALLCVGFACLICKLMAYIRGVWKKTERCE